MAKVQFKFVFIIYYCISRLFDRIGWEVAHVVNDVCAPWRPGAPLSDVVADASAEAPADPLPGPEGCGGLKRVSLLLLGLAKEVVRGIEDKGPWTSEIVVWRCARKLVASRRGRAQQSELEGPAAAPEGPRARVWRCVGVFWSVPAEPTAGS